MSVTAIYMSLPFFLWAILWVLNPLWFISQHW